MELAPAVRVQTVAEAVGPCEVNRRWAGAVAVRLRLGEFALYPFLYPARPEMGPKGFP
jgi:hypothetical protein